jgi:hypothetical protein
MKYDTPRLRAKAAGLKRYEGLPCPNCGGTTRLVCNQQCLVCKRNKKYEARKKKQKYQTRGRPKVELTAEQKAAKKEKQKAYNRDYHADPKNRPAIRAKGARRRCAKLQRIPCWVSKEDRKRVRALYAKALQISVETGIPHHVDHIIPLRGKKVSGLHVLDNLQIIPAQENLAKSASFAI